MSVGKCNHVDYPTGDFSSSNCVLDSGHKGCHQYLYLGKVRPTILTMAFTDQEGYDMTEEDKRLIKSIFGL